MIARYAVIAVAALGGSACDAGPETNTDASSRATPAFSTTKGHMEPLNDDVAIEGEIRKHEEKLKDHAFHPQRLKAYIKTWPPNQRRQTIQTFAGDVPGLVGALPGTEARRLLDASRMTPAEFEAHKKAKKDSKLKP